MLLGTWRGSLLEIMLSAKSVVRAGERRIRATQDFNAVSYFH